MFQKLPSRATFIKLVHFLLAGLPSFLIAVPLNILFVRYCGWPMPAAYALVLVIQVTINFWICVNYVFNRDLSRSLPSLFVTFLAGILSARIMDWGIYSLLTWLGMNYILAQFLNVALFSILKFSFAKRTLEGTHSPSA